MTERVKTALVVLDRARQALAEAHSIGEVKDIRDQAEAIRLYYAQQSGGLEMQNHAAEIKLRAERQLGELLAEMEKNEGQLMRGPQLQPATTGKPTLRELGIEKTQSMRWQQEATVPVGVFEAYVQETQAASNGHSELTSVGLLRIAQGLERERRRVETAPLPTGVFDVILADPPWQYNNSGSGLTGIAENHYPTLPLIELCRLNIPAAPNAALFLWVTNPMLAAGLVLAEAWGFEYKTNVVWIKSGLKKPGIGFYVRGQHELLFICTRGSMVPDQRGREPIGSVLVADVQKHSRKPEAVYELIEAMYPEGRYIELFARQHRQGWTAWGADSLSPMAANTP